MAIPNSALAELAQAYGVAGDFYDWQGRHVGVPPATITAVLAAMGIDAGTEESAHRALAERWLSGWRRILPPALVFRQGTAVRVNVHVRHLDPVRLWIDLEGGGRRDDLHQAENFAPPQDIDGVLTGEATFVVPEDLPLGYHTLRAESVGREAATELIVSPPWLGTPERMGSRRAWGFATQLYSVPSEQSWGVGDLADLTDLAVWSAAEHGAGYLLVNPMHAAAPGSPMEPSPYLPTTRRFANPMYLRVERIPEFAYLPRTARDTVEGLRITAAAASDQIDRDRAWSAKRAALQEVHAVRRSAGRDIAYRAFQRREGKGLTDYATWCALAEKHGPDWPEWPAEVRHPDGPGVAQFRVDNVQAIDFHAWLQWVLDDQLAVAQSTATRAGMALGLMHDLAVGVHPKGADSWALQDIFASGITVGAPPDAYNQAGQDWSQPPWRPDRLAELGYAPLRAVVAAALRHAGGLRVDHIIGLFRLWWIPKGNPPTDGTYVRYDHEAMVGILALEAHRARAVVVGEDLGTVEPWVRDYLAERGILGTSILWFERDYDHGDAPLAPEQWREFCLASVTTHDLPPTAGYLAGDHIRLRSRLGLLTRPLDEELAADHADRRSWLEELRTRGALTTDHPVGGAEPDDGDNLDPDSDEGARILLALHRFLTWTPAKLLGVALTDAVGERMTQNQPGTIDEYPNWRVPLCGPDGERIMLEDIFDSPRASRLAEMFDER